MIEGLALKPDAEPVPTPAQGGAGGLARCAFVGCVLAVAAGLAIHRLTGTPYALNFSAAFEGARSVIGTTLPAAVRVWSFWAVAAVITAGVLLRIDQDIGLRDAILGGASGVWVAAYVLGQLLGPIALFRGPVIWLLLIAAAVWLVRGRLRIPISRPTEGQSLALLAFGLLLVGLLPLELGSPVVPYMDVLSYPASVQRILSFGRYLPFDNDPYGCWGPQAQTPGLELLLAFLAMGARVGLGVLAQSAAMVPMAALIIFATYRLGAALAGESAGGIAALMLFFTNTFRRMVGMRGTAVDFALVALGLAFLLDRRSRRTTTALGCLILGTAVASHAIDGGLAIAVAAAALVWRAAFAWRGDAALRTLVLKLVCMTGAILVAAPEFAIATARVVPYPVLPLLQFAGIAVIVLAARRLSSPAGPSATDPALSVPATGTGQSAGPGDLVMVALFAAALVYTNATHPDALFTQIFQQFPLLSIFAVLGLIAIAALRGPEARAIEGSSLAIPLLAAIVVEALGRMLGAMNTGVAFGAGVADLHYKLDEYWTPYFLVFPAAVPISLLYRRGSKPVVVAALLAILVYPWNPRFNANYDYEEHSVAENWAIDLRTAARGYWFSTPDARWTVGPREFALVARLQAEQAAGRITLKTHILHIAHDAIVWRDFNRFSVFTGIDDDPVVYEIPASDLGWMAGGRVRTISALPSLLAEKPPYILTQAPPPAWMHTPPDGYELIFDQGPLKLFRRRDLFASQTMDDRDAGRHRADSAS